MDETLPAANANEPLGMTLEGMFPPRLPGDPPPRRLKGATIHPSALARILGPPVVPCEAARAEQAKAAHARKQLGTHPAPRVKDGMDGADVLRLEDHRRV